MNQVNSTTNTTVETVDLKNRWLAGLLAWLIPGAGHFYQGRRAKGILFFVCVLGTFYYGLTLGSSRVVFAAFRPYESRTPLAFVPQIMVGLPATPAIVQYQLVKNQKAPIWNNYMAPPVLIGDEVPKEWAEKEWSKPVDDQELKESDFPDWKQRGVKAGYVRYWPTITNPHRDDNLTYLNEKNSNQFSVWHNKYGFRYDLGSTFTWIAGLLNLLVIYDAVAGPAFGYRMTDPKKTPPPAKQEQKAAA
jgi:hypothetical protein